MPVSSDSAVALETYSLHKRVGRRTAVDDLTMSVPARSIAGFVGPNGARKTTTLRLLVGLVRPDAGSGRILGLELADSVR
jgi:ABC-type multidrug transport system ATPase subunit